MVTRVTMRFRFHDGTILAQSRTGKSAGRP
jgi:hypothetical protein